jgi:sulfur-oxidizing protein SoxA
MKTIRFAALAAALLAAAPGRAQTKSAADGIAEYRKMLEDGNPAELFEAKGEACGSSARAEERLAREVRPGQGPGRGQGRLGASCRATLPTRAGCRTWSRAC